MSRWMCALLPAVMLVGCSSEDEPACGQAATQCESGCQADRNVQLIDTQAICRRATDVAFCRRPDSIISTVTTCCAAPDGRFFAVQGNCPNNWASCNREQSEIFAAASNRGC